jgi:hypothetical protein
MAEDPMAVKAHYVQGILASEVHSVLPPLRIPSNEGHEPRGDDSEAQVEVRRKIYKNFGVKLYLRSLRHCLRFVCLMCD